MLHPPFRKPYSYSNDAVIFQIKSSPIAQPLVLDNSYDFTGWPSGSLYSFPKPTGVQLVRLLSLLVWSRKECTSMYANADTSVLCAEGKANVDARQGDSGSPLTLADSLGNTNYLVGLVSSRFQCGTTGVPGFYTRMSSLESFIEQNVVKASWKIPIVNKRSNTSVNSLTPA